MIGIASAKGCSEHAAEAGFWRGTSTLRAALRPEEASAARVMLKLVKNQRLG